MGAFCVRSREMSAGANFLIAPGKAVRSGQTPQRFSQDELDMIAEKYVHCSANWNVIVVNTDGLIHGGASPSELIGFFDRPDEQWKRSVSSMDGKQRAFS